MSKRKSQEVIPLFCERIKRLRLDKKMNQAEFADYLSISRPTVGFYENGNRIPDARMILEIATKCQVSADYLLGITDNPTVDTARIDKLFGLSTKMIEYLQNEKYRTFIYRIIESDKFSELCMNAERMNLYSAVLLAIEKLKDRDTGQFIDALVGNSERNYAFQLKENIYNIISAKNEEDIFNPTKSDNNSALKELVSVLREEGREPQFIIDMIVSLIDKEN